MKQFLLFMALVASVAVFSCQKEQLPTVVSTDLNGVVSDRDSNGHHGHHGNGKGHHHGQDSIKHQHDSTHVHDSTHTHGNHNDSLHTGGGHHPNDSTHVSPCQSSVETVTVADLPQAAQAFLTANYPAAVIVSVKKITRKNCKITYEVKIEGVHKRIKFDEAGNKIGG